MSEKELEKLLEGYVDSLPDGQKEKAKACKTIDELIALIKDTGMELPDALLDAAAGGRATDPGKHYRPKPID